MKQFHIVTVISTKHMSSKFRHCTNVITVCQQSLPAIGQELSMVVIYIYIHIYTLTVLTMKTAKTMFANP